MKTLEEAIKTELEDMDAQPEELDTLYMDNKAKSATVKVCTNSVIILFFSLVYDRHYC